MASYRVDDRGEDNNGHSGPVRQCDAHDYLDAVAGDDGLHTVAHIYDNTVPACERLNVVLEKLARQYDGEVRFVKLPVAASEGTFRAEHVPILVVYDADGEVVRSHARVALLLGASFTSADVVRLLAESCDAFGTP